MTVYKPTLTFITLSLGSGGAEKVIVTLIKQLRSDWNIHLIVLQPGGYYEQEVLSLKEVNYHVLDIKGKHTPGIIKSLRQTLIKTHSQIALSFLWYPNIITGFAVKKIGIPHIACERNAPREYFTTSLKHRIWKYLLSKTYKRCRFIIANAEVMRQQIIEDFGIDPLKTTTIYNGLDFETLVRESELPTNEYPFSDNEKVILGMGRLEDQKNFKLLIQAFYLISPKHPELRLLIIGEGSLRAELEQLIQTLGLSEKVLLPGFIPQPARFIKKADTFCLSSSFEGFPNALAEAFFINGHVVSTDCPTGPSEIISNHSDGLLVELDKPEKLALALEKMTYDEELRRKVFANSRIASQRFSSKQMCIDFDKILKKVLANHA